MDNPFKRIEPEDKLPQQAKQQALSNIYSIRFVMDMLDLFVVKIGAAVGESLPSYKEIDHTDNPSSDSESPQKLLGPSE